MAKSIRRRGKRTHVQSERTRRTRHVLTALVAALGALGVLGAIGAYYVPGILDRLGATVSGRIPLDYDVIMDRTATSNYVFPATVDPVEFATAVSDVGPEGYSWARKHGGVLAEEENVRLVLRGRDTATVHIDDVRIKVVRRTAPRAGWYNANLGCGAGVEPRLVETNFDRRPSTPTWRVEGEIVDRPAFTVSSSDEEVFDVRVYTSRDEVTWVVEIPYSSVQAKGVLRVDDHGKPFMITSVANAKAYQKDYDTNTLVRFPARDGSNLKNDDHPVC